MVVADADGADAGGLGAVVGAGVDLEPVHAHAAALAPSADAGDPTGRRLLLQIGMRFKHINEDFIFINLCKREVRVH